MTIGLNEKKARVRDALSSGGHLRHSDATMFVRGLRDDELVAVEQALEKGDYYLTALEEHNRVRTKAFDQLEGAFTGAHDGLVAAAKEVVRENQARAVGD